MYARDPSDTTARAINPDRHTTVTATAGGTREASNKPPRVTSFALSLRRCVTTKDGCATDAERTPQSPICSCLYTGRTSSHLGVNGVQTLSER
jgi:hypothetical protein